MVRSECICSVSLFIAMLLEPHQEFAEIQLNSCCAGVGINWGTITAGLCAFINVRSTVSHRRSHRHCHSCQLFSFHIDLKYVSCIWTF